MYKMEMTLTNPQSDRLLPQLTSRFLLGAIEGLLEFSRVGHSSLPPISVCSFNAAFLLHLPKYVPTQESEDPYR